MLDGGTTMASLPTDTIGAFSPQARQEPRRADAPPPLRRAGPVAPIERSGYQPSGQSRPAAFVGSAILVGAFVSALALMNVVPAMRAKHSLAVVELAITPPPPPPKQPPAPRTHHDVPQPKQPLIVAPPPIVAMPAPPVVATVRQPDPPPIVQAPPAPAAAVAPAPPAAPAVANAGDLSSTMVSAKPPTYPLESRRKHEEGTVRLKLRLGTDGQVTEVSVAQSSGSERLDQAALSAVRKWRWKPTIRNGEPVLVQGMVTIPFVLTR